MSTYANLLRHKGFLSFLGTQFLGAFNDNVFKMIVSVAAVSYSAGESAAGARYLALTGFVFVLPFLLFAGYAGQLADRYSKTRVLIVTKAFEIGAMLLALLALQAFSMPMLLGVLFLLAAQANFFSPAKYGILPEILPREQLSKANALLELTTFVAIVAGGCLGALLFEHWRQEPHKMGLALLSLAVLGSLWSFGIPKTAAAAPGGRFHLNPIHEILFGVRELAADRPMAVTVVAMSFFWFAGGLVQLNLVLFVKEVLGGSETQVGLLGAALAVGIGLGSMAAGWISGSRIEVGMTTPALVFMGLAIGGIRFAGTLPAAAVILMAAGLFGGLFIVPLNAFLQEEAPAAVKGRILATNNFANMVGVILASGALWLLHDVLALRGAHIFAVAGLLTLAASLIMLIHLARQTLRFFLWSTLHILFRLKIVGAENIPSRGGALVVANHVSYADAFLVGAATPRYIRYLLWKPIYEIPFLKPVFELLHALPINPFSPKEAMSALIRARKEIEAGEIAGIFPEGAITRNGQLMPFKRGYERIVEDKRGGYIAPIIPVWVEGLWGHPLSMKGGKLFASRKWNRPRVTIYVGEPIREPISAEALRGKMMELSTVAAEHRVSSDDTLGRRLVGSARANWGRLALADSFGKELTFGRALTASLLLSKWLHAHAPEERHIGLLLPNSVGAALANFAVTLSGRVAVNLNFTAGAACMEAAVRQCGIRTVLTSKLFLAKQKIEPMEGAVYLEDLLPRFSGLAKAIALLKARLFPLSWIAKGKPNDVAAVIFSSGSTGDPKGVELTHWNLLSNIDGAAQIYPVGRTDCMLGILPFFHSFGFTYNLWFPPMLEFPTVMHPNPSDANVIGELAAKYRATFLLSTPTFCATYARKCSREQFTTLRYVVVGAEKLRRSVAEQFQGKFGVVMFEGYGCTEMSPVVAVNGPDYISDDPRNTPSQFGNRADSVGRPLPGVAVRLVDPHTLEPVESGEEGMLLVKGPSRMRGYLGQPERTAGALHEGYYKTGDMAKLDEDGFLYITGRLSRFSKIAGEMVPHLKIEEVLQEVLGESLCFVTGVPDEQRSERLVVLYADSEVSRGTLVEHLAAHGLPALWIPKRDQFFRVESIPTLGTGKTDLRRAQQLAMELMAAQRQGVGTE